LDDFIGSYLKLIMNILTVACNRASLDLTASTSHFLDATKQYWEVGGGAAGKAADTEVDAEGSDDDEADDEGEAEAQSSEALSKKHRTRIRGLALRRITEVIEMYHAVLDLTPYIRGNVLKPSAAGWFDRRTQ
jgi:hypothetical protein